MVYSGQLEQDIIAGNLAEQHANYRCNLLANPHKPVLLL